MNAHKQTNTENCSVTDAPAPLSSAPISPLSFVRAELINYRALASGTLDWMQAKQIFIFIFTLVPIENCAAVANARSLVRRASPTHININKKEFLVHSVPVGLPLSLIKQPFERTRLRIRRGVCICVGKS